MNAPSHLPPVSVLAATYALESVKGFGPQKFRELHASGLTPGEVLANVDRLPIAGKRGDTFRAELRRIVGDGLDQFEERALKQVDQAARNNSHILLHGDPDYPVNLWASNNPVPVVYVHGDLDVLRDTRAVACVGSRGIGGAYEARQGEFATYAATSGWTVVSGFALGADTVAHRAARDAGGATVCVMPSGLDRPFPPENRSLWRELLDYPSAAFLSEFAFGTAAAALTLRKRNKTIVALALGVLVGQSSAKGGAMNAYRFAVEQHKPVAAFRPDGTDATSGNRLIGDDENGTLFAEDRREEQAWASWLRRLSSST